MDDYKMNEYLLYITIYTSTILAVIIFLVICFHHRKISTRLEKELKETKKDVMLKRLK